MSEQDDAFREWWKQATEELRRTSRRSPYYAESLAREAWNASRQAQHGALLEELDMISAALFAFRVAWGKRPDGLTAEAMALRTTLKKQVEDRLRVAIAEARKAAP